MTATAAPNWDKPDAYEKVLAAAATLLLLLVAIALLRGAPHWHEHGLPIWSHLLTVVLALAIAPVQLLRRRGDLLHRVLGRIWAVLVFGTALITFAIRTGADGNFSPIHLLSVVAIVCVPTMVWAARTGRIAIHRGFARGMVTGALVIAGAFTLLPSRVLGGWLFG